MLEYSNRLMDHFQNPRNVGTIEDADGVGKLSSDVCGDIMHLYIKVANGKITDVKFTTFGCAAAVASGSMATEMIKGLPLEEASKITKQDIADSLDGVPEPKMHCSLLAADCLRLAIEDYCKKRRNSMKCEFCGVDIPVEECMFARRKVIDGKEYLFCCDRCIENFELREEEQE